MTLRRWPSGLSAASSTESATSIFSATETSNETEGTEPFSTPRSCSNTFGKQPLAFPKTKEGYVPHKPYIKIVLGTASLGSALSPIAKINTPEAASAFVSTFRSRGYSDIDTARAYPVGRGGTCEQLLGEKSLRLRAWSNVSTRWARFFNPVNAS